MSYRIAESLEQLRRQLNAAFPRRSKASDGGIGDAAHASRNSDHNPWLKDSKGVGVVTARDFTHDPANGIDCQWLATQLVASRDPRIKYIIWNRQICSSKQQPWKWRPYTGANAHNHHLHISVNSDAKLYDSKAAWDLDIAVTTPNHFADLRDDEINLDVSTKSDLGVVGTHPKPAKGSDFAAVTAEGESSGSPSTNQTAENITNVNNAPKTIPDNFKPENKTVDAPPPSGMMKKATAWLTGLGIGLPSLTATVEAIKNYAADGTINIHDAFGVAAEVGKFVLPYAVYLGIAFVVFWGIKELLKQVSLIVKIWVNGKADMHNVEVKPFDKYQAGDWMNAPVEYRENKSLSINVNDE